MLGYNTMKEVALWCQFEKEGDYILQFKKGTEEISLQQHASKEKANTVHFILTDLLPGTSYNYQIKNQDNTEVFAEGSFTTQKLWQYREDPPIFKFAIGSCTYFNDAAYDRPGKPYGKGDAIFSSILKQQPEAMLWLGDNIYLRESDWTSRSGIMYRYTHYKSQEALQKLWKSMHHYAIWDDHDFGPNDANRGFVHKNFTKEAFDLFWANPNSGIIDGKGISNQFSYNDIDFFLLDNRTYRSPNDRISGKREILGKEQIHWLIDALASSKASFKIVAVGGQVLSPAAVWENHATFPEEREYLLNLIEEEQIKNVIFLSGDRHKTELTKWVSPSGLEVYDYTSSPLSSTAYNSSEEGNTLRVEGTHVSTQNFGILEFVGDLKNREVALQAFDTEGKLLWEKKIRKQ